MSLEIRTLQPQDRPAWEPLWDAYTRFYEHEPDQHLSDLAWQRFHDADEPMYALGAFEEGRLLGITHFLFHRSTSLANHTCYLQDLYTVVEARGRGVGRALIESVVEQAREAGSARVYWMTHETNDTARVLYDKLAERSGFIQYRIAL